MNRLTRLLPLLALSATALAQSPASSLPPTFGIAAETVPARPETIGDLSATLETIRKQNATDKNLVPALAAVMLDSRGILAQGAAGTRRAGSSTPVTINDQWHLGSCTKAMTASLCAVLVQEDLLKWDTTIGDLFTPKDPNSKLKIPDGWKDQQLQHLLTHSGGAPENLDENGLWNKLWEFTGSPVDARQMLLEGVLKTGPRGKPGQRYYYSNAGYAIAGHMAETTAGRPYEVLIQDRLFTPLGITTAGFGAPGTAGSLDQPRGHTKTGDPVEPGPNHAGDNPPAIAPAGTIHMTLPDWSRFVQAHLRGARGQTDQANLLTPESYAKLHTPGAPGSDYAMGWIVTKRPQWAKGNGPDDTGRALTHAGSNTMWTASVWIAPEIDRAFLVATNTANVNGASAREDALVAMINADRESRGLKPIKP